MKLFSKFFRRSSKSDITSSSKPINTADSTIQPWELPATEKAQIVHDMNDYLQLQQNDPFWYERSYINGYYGDLFEESGGDRNDLAAFGEFLLRFGMDLH